jgi:hypothetical protein
MSSNYLFYVSTYSGLGYDSGIKVILGIYCSGLGISGSGLDSGRGSFLGKILNLNEIIGFIS